MKPVKKNIGNIFLFMAITMFVIIAGVVVFDQPSYAQVDVGSQVFEETGLSGTDPRIIVARVIQVALGFLGIITLGLLVYAGFLWMTAAGEPERVTRAKTILRNGLIGLVIIVSAFGIASFVLRLLGTASGITGLGGCTCRKRRHFWWWRISCGRN